MIYSGLLLGMLASGFHVLIRKRRLTDLAAWAYLLGGAAGGMSAVLCLMPVDVLSRKDIVLIALAGYFMADIFAALMNGQGKRA